MTRTFSIASAILMGLSVPLLAQQPQQQPAAAQPGKAAVTVKEARPGLLKQAKVAPDSAQAAALATVPSGKVTSARISERGKELVYDFMITAAGKRHDVRVNAATGKVTEAPMRAKPKATPPKS